MHADTSSNWVIPRLSTSSRMYGPPDGRPQGSSHGRPTQNRPPYALKAKRATTASRHALSNLYPLGAESATKEEVAVLQISACTPSGRSPQTERATASSNHFRPRSRSFHVAFPTFDTEGNTEFSTPVDENGPHQWKTLETYPQVWTKGVFEADGYHLPPRPTSARPLHRRVAGKAMANNIKPIADQRHHGEHGPKCRPLPALLTRIKTSRRARAKDIMAIADQRGISTARRRQRHPPFSLSPALANRPPPTKNDTYRPPSGMLMRFSS